MRALLCMAAALACGLAQAQQVEYGRDLDKAKSAAAANGKDILVLASTGDDLPFGDALLASDEFARLLGGYNVVKVTVPSGAEQWVDDKNERVAQFCFDYGISGASPVMIIMDSKGRPYMAADIGGMDGATADAVGILAHDFGATRIMKVFMDAYGKAATIATDDEEKAQYLEKALGIAKNYVPPIEYEDEMDRIIGYDKDNGLGLRDGYLIMKSLFEIRRLVVDHKAKEAEDAIKAYVDKYSGDKGGGGPFATSPTIVQFITYYRAQAARLSGDKKLSGELFMDAALACPTSPMAGILSGISESLLGKAPAKVEAP